MSRTKGGLLVFLFLLSYPIVAQNRLKEMVNVAYAWNPEGYFSAFDAKLGLEYFKTTHVEASAVMSLREADLAMNKFLKDDRHLKNYKLSLPIVYKKDSGWVYIFSPSLSNRNVSHSFVVEDKSVYFSGIALANFRRPGPDTKWIWSLGLLYSKEIEDHFFLPIFSAMYMSPPLRLQMGFPNLALYYQPTKNWELGVKANFDSTTYTFSKGDVLYSANESPGLRIRVLDVGPVFNYRLSDHVWLNTNLGVVLLAEAQTVSASGSTRDMLFKGDNSIFLRASLSYYPFLN